MIRELVGEFAAPARGLLVAVAAAYLAYLWYDHHRVWAIVLGVSACLVGVVLDWVGKRLLPEHPVAAVWFLEGWVLTPAALAAVAGAAVVLITVALTLPKDTPTSTTQTVAALSTGLTAFITAVFISWAGDEKNSKIADHIRRAFWAKYDRPNGTKPGAHHFKEGSPGEQWVYSDEVGGIQGWSHDARITRAKGIAAVLQSGESDPPT
jgi:hypothetical protein